MGKIRVLCATTKLCNGGVQSFLVNYAEQLANLNVHLDFVVQDTEEQVFDKKVIKYGSRIFHVEPYSKSKIKYIKDFINIVKLHPEYKIIWMHLNYGNIWPLIAAKISKVPHIICHSHSNYRASNILVEQYRKLLQISFRYFATDLWACSTPSALWLYGKDKNTRIIHNAVDAERYMFSQISREHLRTSMNIKEDEVLWINVGNLNNAKNQKFLIDVFDNYHRTHPKNKLIICGEGELRNSLESQIERLGLIDAVHLVGKVQNPEDYMSASDLFVMTSSFEGLPLVSIEAQASVLPCVFSQVIPNEAIFLDNAKIVQGYNIQDWIIAIEESLSINNNRNMAVVHGSGYDIKEEAKKIKDIFNEMVI